METKEIIANLKNTIQNPYDFYQILYGIRDEAELILVCEELKKQIGIDYFELANKAIKNKQDVFFVSHILEKIAFLSILDIQNIIKLYEILYIQMDGDLANFTQYEITKNICIFHKDFSLNLLNELYKNNQDFSIYHISIILLTLHNKHNMNQYIAIKKYLDITSDKNKTLVSIEAISKIDLTDEQQNEIFELLNKIVALNDESFNSSIVYSCNRMKDKYSSFKMILLKLSATKNKNIKFHISRILTFNKKEEISEEWYLNYLFSLTDTMSNELGIVNNLSHVFVNILEASNEYIIIKDFFIKWVKNSDISSNFPSKSLEYFIHDFSSKFKVLHNKFITDFFYMENTKLHMILSRLITKKSTLDAESLEQYSDEDLLFICRKVLGYLYDFDNLKNLIWSISSKNNLSLSSQGLLIDIFINHIGVDYPYNTIEFFKNIDIKNLNKAQKNMQQQILQYVEQSLKTYQSLPRLKELVPYSQESREIHKANQLSMAEVMKKAEQNSIFSQLATKIYIKYGKGNFYNINGQYTKPTDMQKISTEMAFPLSENAHPISSAIQRYHFRVAKKGDK